MADGPDSKSPSRDEKGRLLPGVSGNPGGKNPEREELRRHILSISRGAVDRIEELSKKAKSEKVRMDANAWIAEQAIGRAVVAISGEDGAPLEIKLGDELVESLKRLAVSGG